MKGLRPALRRPQSAGMLSYLLETLLQPNSTFPIDTDQRSLPAPNRATYGFAPLSSTNLRNRIMQGMAAARPRPRRDYFLVT
jgi:hypothetical protein